MVRVTMILLCFLLAAAAAGRYQAEVSVRETRREIQELDRAAVKELSQVQVLRAEIAYLESPERLAKIAARVTDLEPLTGAQLMTADEFVLVFDDNPIGRTQPADAVGGESARKSLAMADLTLAE